MGTSAPVAAPAPASSEFQHLPVLLAEVVDALQPKPGGQYVDLTVGGGGHAAELLRQSAPDGRVLGLDRDPAAVHAARECLAPFGERATVIQADFRDLARVAAEHGLVNIAGILLDLGVSSAQLDTASRGFSFRYSAALDMRMDPGSPVTAATIVNETPAAELTKIFRDYGEEPRARAIAAAIVRRRGQRPFTDTSDLADFVEWVYRGQRHRVHPATRVFQSLRIAVNDELGALATVLPVALDLLRSGGRLAVISFHSLEDRLVKQFFARGASPCECPPQLPICACGRLPSLRIISKRPITPTASEVARNPRARSSKLRVAVKV